MHSGFRSSIPRRAPSQSFLAGLPPGVLSILAGIPASGLLQSPFTDAKWAYLDTNLGRINLDLTKIYKLGRCHNEFPGVRRAILHVYRDNESVIPLDLNNDQVRILFNRYCDDCGDGDGAHVRVGVKEVKRVLECNYRYY